MVPDTCTTLWISRRCIAADYVTGTTLVLDGGYTAQ
jgi:hypothetical protein